METESLPVWLPDLPRYLGSSALLRSQTAAGPELPKKRVHTNTYTQPLYLDSGSWRIERQGNREGIARSKGLWLKGSSLNSQCELPLKTHIATYESCYLSANVGFRVLKDQSQVFNAVGFKEAVNLWLAGGERSTR